MTAPEEFLLDLIRLCRKHDVSIASCRCDDGIKATRAKEESPFLCGILVDADHAEAHTGYYSGDEIRVSLDEIVVVELRKEEP